MTRSVNGMVVRLRALAAEVTRVTLEVGSQGKLGGQAHVPDVEGVWFELVRNVSVECAFKGNVADTPSGQQDVFVSHGSSALYRNGHDRRRSRRSHAEDHDSSRRRNVNVEGYGEFYGGPVIGFRVGGNTSGVGGRDAGYSRWSGAR